MKGGQGVYATKIVTVWTVTGPKQLLNGCQMVKSKIGVINHCLINLICMYVIPEALLYEIFGGILSSTPSSSE